jgi:hypothetical protein
VPTMLAGADRWSAASPGRAHPRHPGGAAPWVLLHSRAARHVIHLDRAGTYRHAPEPGESNPPAPVPDPVKGKHMSTTQDTPAATRTAHEPGAAEVYEIYPGASAIVPVQPRGRRSPGDSEAGMATAEYAEGKSSEQSID